MPVDFSVTNQLASPAIYASSFPTRPAASFKGRLFVDTDNPSTGIYRDTGTAWIAIAGTSVGEIQSLNDVCVVGNTTTTLGIEIFGQSAFGENISPPYGPMPPFGDYALTIGNYSEFQQSLYVQDSSFFNTTVGINTSLTTPLLIGGDTTTSTLTYRTTSAAGITGARHIFQVGNNGATEAMTILNNANVGIGINNPSKKVDIFTTANSGTEYQLSLRNGSGQNNVSSGLVFGFNSSSADPDYLSAISSIITNRSTRAASLTFLTAATGTLVENMRIVSNGNVLINSTTDAGFKLDVNGSGRFSGIITANSAAVAANGSINIENTDPTVRFRVTGGTANKRIYEFRAIALGSALDYMQLRLWNDAESSVTELLSIAATGAAAFTSSVRIGNLTTVQKNALTASSGMVVYDTTLNKLCVYTTVWETITSI